MEADVSGSIESNPNNSPTNEFTANLPDGLQIIRDDLHQDTVTATDGTHYDGPAIEFWVKPQGNGKQGSLLVGGVPFDLLNRFLYRVAGEGLLIRTWNDKRHTNGKLADRRVHAVWDHHRNSDRVDRQPLAEDGSSPGVPGTLAVPFPIASPP